MNYVEIILDQLKNKLITFADAEYALRGLFFDEKNPDPKIEQYRQIYYYLDEAVGLPDDKEVEDNPNDVNAFWKFVDDELRAIK